MTTEPEYLKEFSKLSKEIKDIIDELITETKMTPAEIGACLWLSPEIVLARETQLTN